jgi:hypothetical protein
MPRLSALGSAVMGVAGTQASINGSTPAGLTGLLGNCDWLSNTELFGQDGSDCFTYDVGTDTQSLVAAGGANETWAGGGVWQRWGSYGLDQSNGVTSTVGGAATVSRSGVSAITIDRSLGFGIRTYSAAGSVLTSISCNPTVLEFTRCRDGVVSFIDANGWHLVNATTGAVLPFAARTTTVNFMTTATSGSNRLVLERDDDGQLTLRGATQNTGYVVATGANLFGPDFVILTWPNVRIAYSTGAGELASELVLINLNFANGVMSKATIVSGAPVYVNQPTLQKQSLPASGGSVGATRFLAGVYQQPMVAPQNAMRITPVWYRALLAMLGELQGPIDLSDPSQVTGVLPPEDGGTGVTTGLTVISPTSVQFSDEDLLLGRGDGNGGGDGEEITLGAGLQMVGTVLDVTGIEPGYWSILTNGDPVSPEIIFADGDVVSIFVPS